MKLLKSSKMNELIPLEFHLSQNYPNPFNDKTTIKYCIAYKSEVTLKVLDSENKLIEILVKEEKQAGTYEIEFKAVNLPGGVYFYRLQAGKFVETKKMVLLN